MKLTKQQSAEALSQSPQTGQFNSYIRSKEAMGQDASKVSIPSNGSIQFLQLLGIPERVLNSFISLNPLKRVNSILTAGRNSRLNLVLFCFRLNPLKRVNSILTKLEDDWIGFVDGSQSPQTGQFNSYDKMSKRLYLTQEKSQSPQTGQFNSYG